MARYSSSVVSGFALAAFSVGLAGCGQGKLDNATVSGTVKFQNQPVTGGQVSMFDPSIGIGASAKLGPDGSFKVEGPMRAGNYVVTVLPPPGPPPLPDPNAPPPEKASYVPAKYRSEKTSDLKVDVTPGENNLELVLRP